MIGKLGLVGLGYVLGSRAGRDRYEQIRVVAGVAAKRLEQYGSRGTWARQVARGPSSHADADRRPR